MGKEADAHGRTGKDLQRILSLGVGHAPVVQEPTAAIKVEAELLDEDLLELTADVRRGHVFFSVLK